MNLRKIFNLFRTSYQPSADDANFYMAGKSLPSSALACSAVVACVSLLASTLARLEWGVYRKLSSHYEPVENHPLNILLRDPHGNVDAYTFYEYLFESLFMHGNAYSVVSRNSNSMVYNLSFVDASSVRIENRGYGRTIYNFNEFNPPSTQSRERNMSPAGLLHIRSSFYDLADGRSRSPIEIAAGSSASIFTGAADSLGKSVINGLRSPGWIETQLDWNRETTRKFIEEFSKAFTGGFNTGKVPVMPKGLEFHGINVPPIDQYIISVLKWGVEDVARCYGVPLPLIHSVEGKVNSQAEKHWATFIRTTVAKNVARVGSQFSKKLFTPEERMSAEPLVIWAPTLHIEMPVLSDLANFIEVLARSDVLEQNEARQILSPLNLAPRGDGDRMLQVSGAPDRNEEKNDE